MIVDAVSGWSQNVGDGSPIWGIADQIAGLVAGDQKPVVRRHTCGDDLRPFLESQPGTPAPQGPRMWIVYSYGCARLWKSLCDLKRIGNGISGFGPFDHLVIIAGVPRFWDGQFEISDTNGVWHVDPQVFRAATCFSPRDFCLPESQPIKNASQIFQNRCVGGVDHVSIVAAVAREVLAIARRLWEREIQSFPQSSS